MLEDVVVVEIGACVAVRHCGKMLVDAGATVIALRDAEEAAAGGRQAYLVDHLDAGKRALSPRADRPLDPATAARVDAVVHDGGEGTAGRVAQLRAANPALVVVAVSAYVRTGPDADTPANEFTLQAESGLTVPHTTFDRPPVWTGVEVVEIATSVELAKAVLQGLLTVDAGARGVEADVSRFEAAAGLNLYQWLNERIEGHRQYAAPADLTPGIEAAADGFVCIVALTPDQWSGLKTMIGDPALDDARFDNPMARMAEAAELRKLIRAFTTRHSTAELVELGVAHRVPIAPVTTPETVPELPPHQARGTFAGNPRTGLRHSRPPVRWTPAGAVGASAEWAPAPALVQGALEPGVPRSPRRPVTASATPERPLAGVRVLELGLFHAGPLATLHLAALGADVVKVESVRRPDPIRFIGVPPVYDRFWERGAAFIAPNLGKRAVTIDLGSEEGLAAIRRLVAEVDVIVENYAPKTLDARGLDYAGLRAIKPDLIVARMPAWGLDGPWRDRPGFTYTADATSGMAYLTGYPDRDPLLSGTVVDPFSGLIGAYAVLAALRHRARTGEGGQLELALCDAGTLLSAEAVIEASRPGSRARKRSGNESPHAAPQGCYRSADGGWVAISVATDAQWVAFTGVQGLPAWLRDAALRTLDGRRSRRAELDEALATFCAGDPASAVVERLRAAGVPAAPVALGTDLVEHRQLLARQRVITVDHPIVGPLPYLGSAARFSVSPQAPVPARCPLFGEHNAEVLTELGYGPEEIGKLREAKVIGQSPFGLPIAAAT